MNLPLEIIKNFKKENHSFIKYGLDKEDFYEEFICHKFGKVKKTGHYDIFDFENDKIIIEIKNRKVKYNDYKTTLIGFNKIEAGLADPRRVFFLFGFSDESLWQWELDKSKTYEGRIYTDFSSVKFTTFNKNKLNYYIPISELVCLIKPKVYPLFKSKGCA